MDESMTPMERLVVEYHVWKTQLFKPESFVLDGKHSNAFVQFKQNMTKAQEQDLSRRVSDAWQAMNALDIGKALGEYEDDCPDLSNMGVNPLKSARNSHSK